MSPEGGRGPQIPGELGWWGTEHQQLAAWLIESQSTVGFRMPVKDFLSYTYHFIIIQIIIQIGLSYELSSSVAGCNVRIDRAMTMSLFLMCMMANGY